ncbi:UDP-N-acetylmuramate dehydrogenase [Desulfurobacterium sp.]
MEIKELSGKEITTIGIGGFFSVFFPETEKELLSLTGDDFFVIGGGSNLVLPDRLTGVKLVSLSRLKKFYLKNNRLFAQAGVKISEILRLQMREDFSIFEFLAGVPGVTVGGAVYQNAGAFGAETAHFVKSVVYVDRNGRLSELNNISGFGYRKSPFKDGEIIVGAEFRVNRVKNVREKIRCFIGKRLEKQPPFYLKTAGSTFKNPDGYSAGFLIEKSGLKGFSSGGIEVSRKHANFLINKGNATFADFCKIVDVVKNRVFNVFGIELELEVKVPGVEL